MPATSADASLHPMDEIDLKSATKLALACVNRYRISEPTRQADIEVARLKAR
jgi:deoxyinosine 3'endonuclease (endonuclease V)